MTKVTQIASYIAERYKKEFSDSIDEIKLQKLLYFTQREHIIRTGKPMFEDGFHAWKYGPVIPCIHEAYKKDELHEKLSDMDIEDNKDVFDYIFTEYAGKRTMSLVGHSHCELSWIRARIGYHKYDKSDVPMKIEDIFEDAQRARQSRTDLVMRHRLHGFILQHNVHQASRI